MNAASFSIVAGTGAIGCEDGECYEATFKEPLGIAIGPHGSVVVVDNGNRLIRKVSATGQVTTLVGEAELGRPIGIAMDGTGTLYVADQSRGRMRAINPQGRAVRGGGSDQFSAPTDVARGAVSDESDGEEGPSNNHLGIAADSHGNIFIADRRRNCVRRVTPNGEVAIWAGSGYDGFTDGCGSDAQFSQPLFLAVDGDGNVLVSDYGNDCIRMIDADRNVTTLTFHTNRPPSFCSAIHQRPLCFCERPTGIAVDDCGALVVASEGANSIFRIHCNLRPAIARDECQTRWPAMTTAMDDLGRLLRSAAFADVTLIAEGEEVHAHRCILAARSEYFATLLASPLEEAISGRIQMQDTSAAALRSLLQFLYVDELATEDDGALVGMAKLCHQFQIPAGYRRCRHHLQQSLNHANAVQRLVDFHMACLSELRDDALQYVVHNLSDIRASAAQTLELVMPHTDLMAAIIRGDMPQ